MIRLSAELWKSAKVCLCVMKNSMWWRHKLPKGKKINVILLPNIDVKHIVSVI